MLFFFFFSWIALIMLICKKYISWRWQAGDYNIHWCNTGHFSYWHSLALVAPFSKFFRSAQQFFLTPNFLCLFLHFLPASVAILFFPCLCSMGKNKPVASSSWLSKEVPTDFVWRLQSFWLPNSTTYKVPTWFCW